MTEIRAIEALNLTNACTRIIIFFYFAYPLIDRNVSQLFSYASNTHRSIATINNADISVDHVLRK
jgi:uncharacterized protein YqhQ